jgi:SAM-dependent methyltransferase
MKTVAELEAKYFQNYRRPDARLDETIRRYITSQSVILDAGAGRGDAFRYDYKSRVRRVVGVDLDERVLENEYVHEGVVASLAELPFPDDTFDLVISRSVFEHLTDPQCVFRELRRVLRPDGYLVFRTPNRFHYFALGARVTPYRFHRWFNEKRGFPAGATFPTSYRANDRFTLRKLAQATGFTVEELHLFELKPSCLFFHPLAYRAGIAYGRLVERFEALQDLRSNIIGVLRVMAKSRLVRSGPPRVERVPT